MAELIVVAIPLVIVLVLLTFACTVITKQQHVRFIETFGRYSGTRAAGLSFKLPYPIQITTPNF